MGNTSNEPITFLGEVNFQKAGETAILSFDGCESCNVQVIVQDKLGRSVLSIDTQLDSSGHLQFETKELSNGDYHAWIYVNDKVFVRQFTVEGKAEGGLIGRMFSRFKKS
jgi:hypothetical protein